MASDIYSMSTDMADMISEILVVQKLLSKIASESTLGTNQATPSTVADVKGLIDKIAAESNIKEYLNANVEGVMDSALTPVSPEPKDSTTFDFLRDASKKLTATESFDLPTSPNFQRFSTTPWTGDDLGNLATKSLLAPELPTLPPEFSSSKGIQSTDSSIVAARVMDGTYVPPTPGLGTNIRQSAAPRDPLMDNLTPATTQVASNIFNPTIHNKVNPSFTPPAINVAAQQRDPGYFYRNLATEVRPQIDYRIPVGVQQANQDVASSPTRAGATTINITNKIDANSQREMYAKIGDIQTQAIITAIGNLA
jgi:hypothetical protein